MKKIKLIATLTTFGSLAAATPIVVTGCSSSTQNFDRITLNGIDIYPNEYTHTFEIGKYTFDASDFKAFNGNEVYTITKISAKSYDTNAIEVINAVENQFTLNAKNAAKDVKVEITVEDDNGKKGTATGKITIEKQTQNLDSITFLGQSIYPKALSIPLQTGYSQIINLEDFKATKDGKEVKLTKLSATSSNNKAIRISESTDVSFDILVLKAGEVELKINVEDANGNKGTGFVEIEVTGETPPINGNAEGNELASFDPKKNVWELNFWASYSEASILKFNWMGIENSWKFFVGDETSTTELKDKDDETATLGKDKFTGLKVDKENSTLTADGSFKKNNLKLTVKAYDSDESLLSSLTFTISIIDPVEISAIKGDASEWNKYSKTWTLDKTIKQNATLNVTATVSELIAASCWTLSDTENGEAKSFDGLEINQKNDPVILTATYDSEKDNFPAANNTYYLQLRGVEEGTPDATSPIIGVLKITIPAVNPFIDGTFKKDASTDATPITKGKALSAPIVNGSVLTFTIDNLPESTTVDHWNCIYGNSVDPKPIESTEIQFNESKTEATWTVGSASTDAIIAARTITFTAYADVDGKQEIASLQFRNGFVSKQFAEPEASEDTTWTPATEESDAKWTNVKNGSTLTFTAPTEVSNELTPWFSAVDQSDPENPTKIPDSSKSGETTFKDGVLTIGNNIPSRILILYADSTNVAQIEFDVETTTAAVNGIVS